MRLKQGQGPIRFTLEEDKHFTDLINQLLSSGMTKDAMYVILTRIRPY